MSQILAVSKGRVPNVLDTLIANYGTLIVHAPDGKWYYFAKEWLPGNGLTNRQFIKLFHTAPPTNVPIEWWGIVPGLIDNDMCRDQQWTRKEIEATLEAFVDMFTGGGVQPRVEGRTIRYLSKAKYLSKGVPEHLMTKAPADLPGRVRQDLMEV
jgi:hypothetical protein